MRGNLQLCYKLGIEMIQMAAGVMRLPFLLLEAAMHWENKREIL